MPRLTTFPLQSECVGTLIFTVGYMFFEHVFLRLTFPVISGMEHDVLQSDPQLTEKRDNLVRNAGRRLAEANMVIFDEINNTYHITDLGRIAAKYYLKHETVEVFSEPT